MTNNLLREYIQEYFLKFSGFGHDEPERSKPSGFLRKINSFFGGGSSEIASEWIEDAEDVYDIAIGDKTRRDIEAYVKKKYPIFLKKAKGDEGKSKSMMKRSIDFRYLKKLTDIEREEP